MIDEQRARRLGAMVKALMDAASQAEPDQLGGAAVDGQLIVDAFNYITAAMLEAHPDLTTNAKLRGAADVQAKALLDFMRGFRLEFERSGIHAWDVMNQPPPVMQ